ncbi:MAG: hypothetical protein INR68_04435 [Methylobacterium mesophilicum]|nr:hypothetical protein [Methylobacterium mesophilicum]
MAFDYPSPCRTVLHEALAGESANPLLVKILRDMSDAFKGIRATPFDEKKLAHRKLIGKYS